MLDSSEVTVTEGIALEHAIFLRVFEEVERVLPELRSAAEVGRLAKVMGKLLETHAELEAHFAFVALNHTLQHKRCLTTLYEEHQELNERLRQVHEARTCEGARGLLRAGMDSARGHFQREERDLFPVLEQALGLGVLTVLGEGFKKAVKTKANRVKRPSR